MNGWKGWRLVDITGGYGVPRENDNGKRVIEFYLKGGYV